MINEIENNVKSIIRYLLNLLLYLNSNPIVAYKRRIPLNIIPIDTLGKLIKLVKISIKKENNK